MDLLFSRYASPFCYLDSLLESGQFARGIANIYDISQDEKLWELYLVNSPYNKMSFAEFKKNLTKQPQTQSPLSKLEIVATVEKSQNILKNFKPLKKLKQQE